MPLFVLRISCIFGTKEVENYEAVIYRHENYDFIPDGNFWEVKAYLLKLTMMLRYNF